MSVTRAAGFLAAGVTAGLKASGRPDLALVVNTGPDFTAAAVFTGNRVKAAPVLWSQQVLADGRVRAVVLNSGGANACTGPDGFLDTHRTAEHVAAVLTDQAEAPEVGAVDVAVCSTGLIGVRLPMDLLTAGITNAAEQLGPDGGEAAAMAIMTTDTRAKQASYADEGWSVGGMAKGAGMLAPGLATMLVVLTTDAVVDPDLVQDQLARACRRSFDRVDSDGCMSTNDTVLLLSSGASGVRPHAGRLPGCSGRALLRSGPPAARRRRGSGARDRDHRRPRGHRGRRCRGRSGHCPQQPLQVRDLRWRPQLGTGARRDRHHLGGLRARPARRLIQRGQGLP